jgi:membrane-bound lytic murein transglycosylase D
MTQERRQPASSTPSSDRRHDDRRHDLRRTAARSGPDRRQRDRRRMTKGIAGLMLASTTFGLGSMRHMQRSEATQTSEPSATHLVLGGGDDDDGEESVASSVGIELPVYLNSAVEGALERYAGNGRVGFEQALERGKPYIEDIQKVFIEEGVPPDLAYVALVESEFKPQAQSGAAARGVWQFMPKTGERFGLEQDAWVDERSDTTKSTRAAAQYLKYLHGKFGDWNMALAAYNYGEGNVDKAVKRAGTSDYWKLAQSGALPRETRDYVPRIHAAILMARNPDQYGVKVEKTPVVATERVEMPAATDLRAVASCTGADLGQIMQLNPALKNRATPIDRTFDIRVPKGDADEIKHCIAELPPAERVAVQKHTVAAGQTLGGIAKRYNTRTSDILRVNKVSPKKIAKGTELLIPKAGILAD